jgi:hypothetical protein
MESNSANASSANGSTGVEAAGKAGGRETNAPNLFKAPQAAEERQTNAPCQGETAENTGTRETNVSEKGAAAARIDSGELDSDGSDSEDEDELTGIELLRDLDLPAPRAPASAALVARSSHIEWPKRVLRQTILVSGIAAEIESSIDRADWDADCYEGCRRLLLRETKRMETLSEERGPEEIPVLVLRGPALDGGGFGECDARHRTHHRPGCLDGCAQPKPGPEGGNRPRPGGQQGNAGPDEGRDGKPPQRRAAGTDSEVGTGEKRPRCTGRNGRPRLPPDNIFNGNARR